MKLIFWYTQQGSAKPGTCEWQPQIKAENFYAVNKDAGLESEGYLHMLKSLLDKGVMDAVDVYIESPRGAGTHSYFNGQITCRVIPNIKMMDQYVKPGDVIFARGGFRSWFDYLVQLKKRGHWLLLYAANTGRQRWKFWNVILDDLCLEGRNWLDSHGRFWFDFVKPINQAKFYPESHEIKRYDVCIGASHIHDKKFQYRGVEAVLAYQQIFGRNLKCVLPGRGDRGVNTRRIPQMINDNNLDIHMPGMVRRTVLRQIYNQSRLTLFFGEGGQNDRGPLESLACGTPILLATPHRHTPVLLGNPYCYVVHDKYDPVALACDIHSQLQRFADAETVRPNCAKFFIETNGMEEVAVPRMVELFNVIRANPKPNTECLVNAFA
jgi:hypothetical protein